MATGTINKLGCYLSTNSNLINYEELKFSDMYNIIADVEEDSNSQTYTPKILLTSYPLVDLANQAIGNMFFRLFNYDTIYDHEMHRVFARPDIGEYIEIWMSQLLRWRRCTGMVVVQRSNKGVRFLFYAFDKIMHGAHSFGTSWDFPRYLLIEYAIPLSQRFCD